MIKEKQKKLILELCEKCIAREQLGNNACDMCNYHKLLVKK